MTESDQSSAPVLIYLSTHANDELGGGGGGGGGGGLTRTRGGCEIKAHHESCAINQIERVSALFFFSAFSSKSHIFR